MQAEPARFLNRNAARPIVEGEIAPDGDLDAWGRIHGEEPEVISLEDQRAISTRARTAFVERRQEELAMKDIRSRHSRLHSIEMDAHRKGIDIRRHTIAIEREMVAMGKLLYPAA